MSLIRNLVLSAALSAPLLRGQPSAGPAEPPSCAEDLGFLTGKIEENYAGYLLEIKPHRAAYDREMARLRAIAAHTDGAGCFGVLNGATQWLHDPHLFVFQSTRLDTAETARRASSVPMVDLSEAGAREYFIARGSRLDPIEGIWYDGSLRVAVVPEKLDKPGGDTFVAVVLAPDTSIWRPGAVRARFVRRAAGRYDADVWARNFALRHLDGRIHKNVLLRISPEMWGKAFPLAGRDSGLLDPAVPRRPTLIVRNGTVVVSIPSHDPSYKPALDSLVAAHARELQSADRLIIDLRGNEGGSSFMSNALLPYIASNPPRPDTTPPFDNAFVMSSPDQIRYFQSAWGPETNPGNARRLARMRAHPGELVTLFDSLDLAGQPKKAADSVIAGPRRIGILIDGGTVSAAEVLVQAGRRSTRVTVIGEPTEGALDYQSTSIVPISPREKRWYLGYPTITASDRLPAGGMRGKGIRPDVRLDLSKTPDAIETADRLLRRR